MTDDEVRRQLSAAIAKRVSAQASEASSTNEIVTLSGSVLRVVPRSSGDAVAVVTMTFCHPIDTDAPNLFRVSRSDPHETLLRLDGRDPKTIDAVAAELAEVFVRQGRRSS
jgi:hypothetical protein